MRELVFALTFRGTAGPTPGSPATRQARTVAPSQVLRTVLSATGIDSGVEPIEGQLAVLESRVERFADGTFVEDGTIAYGAAGSVSFATVGRGTIGASPIPAWVHGAVIWSVTGGTGCFAGASGLITSNFVASADGEVVDQHVARLYLPG
jgi:hypothetical protein